MQKIKVTKNIYVKVDDEDFERINKHKWHLNSGRYPARGHNAIRMHHDIIGRPPVGMVTHHIDGDKLNNQKSNLVFISQSNNVRNHGRFVCKR